ncbi:MAG: phosphate acyltransferase, partial [Ligilactobacillus ruminis]
MKIAVDAMGGDYAPKTVVEGVERARDEFSDTEYLLFGDEKQINGLLKNKDRITVVHSSEVIGMNDEPVKAVRKKKDSSLVM